MPSDGLHADRFCHVSVENWPCASGKQSCQCHDMAFQVGKSTGARSGHDQIAAENSGRPVEVLPNLQVCEIPAPALSTDIIHHFQP